MSEAPPVAQRAARGVGRVRAAWRTLGPEQRLAGLAALGLLVTMFLPWYSATRPVVVKGHPVSVTDSQSAISVFSFVEAAVLLVALAVLALLFARGERRAFHLPGGDGAVVTAAGTWACVLIVWRFFDKPGLGERVTVGLEWGIFVALVAAAFLAVAGNRVRSVDRPEPPLEPRRPPRPPREPVPFRIPDDRPHLEETRVLPDRRPQTPAGRAPAPLSREAAARDTAEFRAVPDEEAGEELTEPLLPEDDPGLRRTEPRRRDEERTEPLPREPEVTERMPRDDDQPPLPGMQD